MTEILTIGYGGKRPKDFFEELERLKPCYVVDVRADPTRAFLYVFTKPWLERHVENYMWIRELGNKTRKLPPVLVNEELGMAKLRMLARNVKRIVLLCAEKDERRCHRLYIKEKLKDEEV